VIVGIGADGAALIAVASVIGALHAKLERFAQ